jgi:CPA2 family monovalent cation:H+ antiporter-2
MSAPTLLRDLVVLVGLALPVLLVTQRLRIPSIVGFLLAGVAIGPHALGLVRQVESVHQLAEVGVVLLLFAIGLELSLARVMRLGRALLQGGAIQVAGTLGAVAVVAAGLGAPFGRAILFGALVALSSTAIVLKVYTERGALDSADGRIVIPIALFQDLCIIPLVLLVNVLGGIGGTGGMGGVATRAAVGVGLAAVVVVALVVGGRVVIPRLLAQIARAKSRELFTLSIVFLGVGAAFVTQSLGLSLALGAFLAGLVISESDYGAQALSDVIPFRDALTGIFFASVGMLLDLRFVLAHPLVVGGAAAGVIVLKGGVATGAALSLRRPIRVAVVAGLGLAQVGEFSFVLAELARPTGLLDERAYQLFLGASVATMLAAPFVIAGARPVGEWVARLAHQPALPPETEAETETLSDHTIIVGYGVNGRNLARVLDGAGLPYLIVEQNAETVERAREELQPMLFGDGTRPHVLAHAHVERARVLVFAISSPADELRGVTVARALSPTVHIVVRTRYVRSMDDLRRAGASEVVPEEFETSLVIFSRVLQRYEVPTNVIAREVQAARVELYGMALGPQAGAGHLERLAQLGIHHGVEILEIEPGARAVGSHPVSLNLRRETGATLIAAVRAGMVHYAPDPEFRFEPGDTVVLVGDHQALVRGRSLFVRADGA